MSEEPPIRAVGLALRDEQILRCSYCHYPWDDWEHAATSAGLPAELASLGRAVMREAYQHQWSPELQTLCGWDDQGQQMLQLAQPQPDKARRLWTLLLDTDGARIDPGQL